MFIPQRLADRIRKAAGERYVLPASARPEVSFSIPVGELAKAMGLDARYPAVCGALDATIFRREYRLELVRRTGPHQSSTVVFEFRFLPPNSSDLPAQASTEIDQQSSSLRSPRGKQRFTLRGEMFEKEKSDFILAMEHKGPDRIQKYSTIINGIRYPIRQVVSCATGRPPIAITSQEAFRVLEKYGFSIEIHE